MKPVDLAVTVKQPAQQAQDRILDRDHAKFTEMLTGS